MPLHLLLLKIRKKLEYYEFDVSVGVIPVEFDDSSHGCRYRYDIPIYILFHL